MPFLVFPFLIVVIVLLERLYGAGETDEISGAAGDTPGRRARAGNDADNGPPVHGSPARPADSAAANPSMHTNLTTEPAQLRREADRLDRLAERHAMPDRIRRLARDLRIRAAALELGEDPARDRVEEVAEFFGRPVL